MQLHTYENLWNEVHQFQEKPKGPHVLAISGGKGGVGKSLTTANLGLSLHQLGMRTLLIDGDLGLANLDVLMGVVPQTSLEDIITGQSPVQDVMMNVYQGMYLLPSYSGIQKTPQLSYPQRSYLFQQLQNFWNDLQFVLIDTAAGASDTVEQWLLSSHNVALVVTPDPTSLTDAYALMKILKCKGHQMKFKLLVNMVKNQEEGLQIFKHMSYVTMEHLGVPLSLLGIVPEDISLKHSVRERNLCVQKYPFSESSKAFRKIALEIVQERVDQPSDFLKKMVGF